MKVKGNGIDDSERFGAGVLITEGSVGKVGKREADTVAITKAFCNLDAGAEFGVETKIEPARSVVVAATETGGKNPSVSEL